MSGPKNNERTDGDCGCKKNVQNKTCGPTPLPASHPLQYYEFTPEEIKALEECDKESFYNRCLPLSTLFATTTYAAIRTGYLNRNRHFGSFPKVILAVLTGHVIGRLSYMDECDTKLRRLPAGSHLGDLMRGYHEKRQLAANPKAK